MGKFDLQGAFARSRTLTENFENEAGAVEYLDLPGALQIALLTGPQGAVNHHEFDPEFGEVTFQLIDLAFAKERCRARLCQRHDSRADNIKREGGGKTYRLVQPRLGRTRCRSRTLRLMLRRFEQGNEHKGSRRFFRIYLKALVPALAGLIRILGLVAQSGLFWRRSLQASSPFVSGSKS